MSMALGHFAFGAVMTSIVVTLLPRPPYPRSLVVGGGLWALLPDAHWVVPIGAGKIQAIHRAPQADLFWFHHTLDAVDAANSRPFAAAMLILFIVATVVGERRAYRSPKFIQRLFDRPEDVDA